MSKQFASCNESTHCFYIKDDEITTHVKPGQHHPREFYGQNMEENGISVSMRSQPQKHERKKMYFTPAHDSARFYFIFLLKKKASRFLRKEH